MPKNAVESHDYMTPGAGILSLHRLPDKAESSDNVNHLKPLRSRFRGFMTALGLGASILLPSQAEGAGMIKYPDLDTVDLPNNSVGNNREILSTKPSYEVIFVHGVDNFAPNGSRGGDDLFVPVTGNTAEEQKFSKTLFFDPDSQMECIDESFSDRADLNVRYSAYMWSRIQRPQKVLTYVDPTRIFNGVHFFQKDFDYRTQIIMPLADHIKANLQTNVRTTLVGHSLGNLVITEAVNFLLDNSPNLIDKIRQNLFILNTADPRSKVAYGVFWKNLTSQQIIEKVASAVGGEASITYWMDPLGQGANFGETLNQDSVDAFQIMPRGINHLLWIIPGIAHEAAFTNQDGCMVMQAALNKFVNGKGINLADRPKIVNLEKDHLNAAR